MAYINLCLSGIYKHTQNKVKIHFSLSDVYTRTPNGVRYKIHQFVWCIWLCTKGAKNSLLFVWCIWLCTKGVKIHYSLYVYKHTRNWVKRSLLFFGLYENSPLMVYINFCLSYMYKHTQNKVKNSLQFVWCVHSCTKSHFGLRKVCLVCVHVHNYIPI